MWDIINYLACTSTIGIASFGLFYYFNKNKAEKIMYEASWGLVTTYHRITLSIENIKDWYKTLNTDEEEIEMLINNDTDLNDNKINQITTPNTKVKLEFFGLTLFGTNFEKYSQLYSGPSKHILETNFDLMFIKKTEKEEEYYKRIENKNELNNEEVEFEILEKPFLQIELIQEDIEGGTTRMSIHKKLDNFYLEGNKILDKIFLQWYLFTFMDITLNENYTLHVIDSDVNMFTLKNKYIKLKKKDEKEKLYNIIETN